MAKGIKARDKRREKRAANRAKAKALARLPSHSSMKPLPGTQGLVRLPQEVVKVIKSLVTGIAEGKTVVREHFGRPVQIEHMKAHAFDLQRTGDDCTKVMVSEGNPGWWYVMGVSDAEGTEILGAIPDMRPGRILLLSGAPSSSTARMMAIQFFCEGDVPLLMFMGSDGLIQ